MNPIKKTHSIPDSRLDSFLAEVKRLNRIAQKLNLNSITVNELGIETRTAEIPQKWYEKPLKIRFTAHIIEVIGDYPQIKGYALISQIEKREPGVIIRSINGEETPEKYQKINGNCDHCKEKRYRKFTYILKSETGEYIEIGSTCLELYTGVKNADKLAEFFTGLNLGGFDEPEEDLISGNRGKFEFSLITYLAHVKRSIDAKGWISSNKFNDGLGYPTKYDALDSMFPIEEKDKLELTPVDLQYAKTAMQAVKEDLEKKTSLNSYENNLKVIIDSEFIRENETGFAASIIPYYRKMVSTHHEKANEFLGEIGKKINNIPVTVLSCREKTQPWGTSYIYNFEDQQGNRLVWFSSSKQDFQIGDSVKIVNAEVKKHTTFNGLNQTQINKPALQG